MVRAMCGAKLMENKRIEDLMEMLGLKETVVLMAKANGVRWYGHVRWRVGVGEFAVGVGLIRPPPITGINPDQNWIDDWIDIHILTGQNVIG